MCRTYLRVHGNKSKIIKYTRVVDDKRMNVALNVEPLKEVKCFKCLEYKVIVEGGIETGEG